jgi:hypothetical protein
MPNGIGTSDFSILLQSLLHWSCCYLIPFVPADILHFGEFLGSLDHEVDEVSTATQATDDEKVGQDTKKSCQMDILLFVILLFIHYRLLRM